MDDLSKKLKENFNMHLVQPVLDQVFRKAENSSELPQTVLDAYENEEWVILFGTTEGEGRVVEYVNKAAQDIFEYSEQDFIGLPSHKLALPEDMAERDELLKNAVQSERNVTEDGIVRLTGQGHKILIKNANVITLDDERQGAYFRKSDVTVLEP